MARPLDAERMALLSNTSQLTLSFYSGIICACAPEIQAVRSKLVLDQQPLTQLINDQLIGGYALVRGLMNEPALEGEVTLDREYHLQGQRSASAPNCWGYS